MSYPDNDKTDYTRSLGFADKEEVRLIENPSKRSTQSRRHRAFFMGTDIAFTDEVKITQPKALWEYCETHKVIHWSKGEGATSDDIRRFIGTIHVWERW